MNRVLITGMSGSGKSAVVVELDRRGYRAFDLDTPEWSHWVDAAPGDTLTPADGLDWVWQEKRVRQLLSGNASDELFVSGCAENMANVFDVIDMVILLSAPLDVLMDRLAARAADGYGHTAEERRKVAELVETIEPLLRQSAHFEIDTTRPVEETVSEILRLAKS